VHYVAQPGHEGTGNLDDEYFERASLPFRMHVMSFDSPELLELLADASVVLGSPRHELNRVAAWCARQGIPYVHTTEYTLNTRRQIIRSETTNPLMRLRRYAWDTRQELANLAIARSAAGLQCNGTPTYDAYQQHARDALLFFDSRVSAATLATPETVQARNQKRPPGAPIRLAFSGRFNAMKGVDHLPLVAQRLVQLGVPFELHLCGAGDLEPLVRQRVAELDLAQHVRFHGVLDYRDELTPFVRDNIDLFVSCHRQGDPSCTYLETFACGVPVVGYDNEALAGLAARVDAAWTTPLDQAELLAERIAELAEAPDQLEQASLSALEFAAAHTFEKTFARRVEQLVRLSCVKPQLTRSLALQLNVA
jgi:glycosyltransferase involved in cell wall biosynthesis